MKSRIHIRMWIFCAFDRVRNFKRSPWLDPSDSVHQPRCKKLSLLSFPSQNPLGAALLEGVELGFSDRSLPNTFFFRNHFPDTQKVQNDVESSRRKCKSNTNEKGCHIQRQKPYLLFQKLSP